MRESDENEEIVGAELDSVQMVESLPVSDDHTVDGNLSLGSRGEE